MVAIMNEALELQVGHRVLEVGAGSGWHAATIAEIVASAGFPRSEWGHVYTLETIQELAEFARRNIMRAHYNDRVTVIHADGSVGYPDKAPFDRIIVTAAAPDIPKPLVEQLKPEGVMVIPVGSAHLFQTLIKITKSITGEPSRENLGGVAFVPMTGQFGHKAA